MKYLYSLGFIFTVFTAQAVVIDDGIISQVKKASNLYSDGNASLNIKSIKAADVIESDKRSCVTLVSFYMEGFSGGNNSSQFIAFLNCNHTKVMGVHPFYHHRNKYDINSATYKNKTICIPSPKGSISFSNKHSIWWSQSEQIGI
ncbi:MAG: hypothetical protein GY787_31070 [Alteromonadales bacterium]|nr:hypothetical protein [Alteromonadales bacterium]MCP4986822.1 hypothetical protein [Colwellia sp.]